MFRGLSVKAVLLGVLIDWALSLAAGLILGVGMIIYLFSNHRHPDLAEVDAMTHSTLMELLSFGFGVIMTLLAGFATGWIARSDRTKNGLFMSLFTVLTSLPFFPFMHGHSRFYFIALIVLTLACGTLGGFLASVAFDRKPAA